MPLDCYAVAAVQRLLRAVSGSSCIYSLVAYFFVNRIENR